VKDYAISCTFVFFGSVLCSFAQPPSSVDPNVSLQVAIASDKREFHVGETIPLHLAYSSAVKDRYQLNRAQYDRSGRMDYEQFCGTTCGSFDSGEIS
jgi:hypothetical protein